MTRMISFAFLIAFIIVIGLLFYNVMIGFFVPVFLAAVLVVVFHPLHQWAMAKTGHRDRLAATITSLLIMLIVLLPITLVVFAASVQGVRLISQVNVSSIRIGISHLRDSLGLHMEHEVLLREAQLEVTKIVAAADQTQTLEPDPKTRDLVTRTIDTLRRLQAEVQQAGGSHFDASFDELIKISEQILLPSKSENELNFQQSAVQLASKFSSLKTLLLGGTYMAFAKEIANPTSEDIRDSTEQVISYLQPKLVSLSGATGSYFARAIFGGLIMIIATFFFLCDGPSMVKTLMSLSPLDDKYEQELLLEFDRISRAVVLATLLSALVQGLTAGLGYFVAGWVSPTLFDNLPLLVLLTTFFALIPFVGPAVVWIPVCCYLAFFEDRPGAAIMLACWGVLVVGTIDNVVKAFVLHGQSQLHPLLALLSVLGGVQSLGPVGIVIGPMVVVMLQTLLSILQRELTQMEERDKAQEQASPAEPSPSTAIITAAATPAQNPAPSTSETPHINATEHAQRDTEGGPRSS